MATLGLFTKVPWLRAENSLCFTTSQYLSLHIIIPCGVKAWGCPTPQVVDRYYQNGVWLLKSLRDPAYIGYAPISVTLQSVTLQYR